jgi:hypothetical protein
MLKFVAIIIATLNKYKEEYRNYLQKIVIIIKDEL